MNKTAIVICGNSGIDYLGTFEDIYVVRSILNLGDKEYEDFVDINADTFYETIAKNPNINLSTSQTPTGLLVNLYEELKQKGYTDIICISLSSKMSGTFQGMNLAASMVEGINVYCIDSKHVSYVEAHMAFRAKELLKSGMTVTDVVAEISKIPSRVKIFVCVDTLKFLVKNGRLSHTAGMLGTLLKLKPLLTFDKDGALVTKQKIRTIEKAKKQAIEIFLEEIKDKKIILFGIYTNNRPEVEEMVKEVIGRCANNVIEHKICPLTPVVGAHAGPGTFAIGYIEV